MNATLQAPHADTAPEALKAEQLVVAGNAVHEQLRLVEFRLATVSALVEHSGADYAERAVHELQAAVEHLALAERRRQAIVAALAGPLGLADGATLLEVVDALPPGPAATALHQLRAAMRVTKAQVERLVVRAEDALGRRITLVAEVLASAGGGEPATYGRPLPSLPRFVDGLL